MSSYPSISDIDFNKQITKKYKEYKIPKKKIPYNDICFPKVRRLQEQQRLLPEIINPKTSLKSILLYHGIGSGKTLTMIKIGEKWREKRKVIFTVPASLIGNLMKELRSDLVGNYFLTVNERKSIHNLDHEDERYKEIIRKSDERINKAYSIYSHTKLITLLETKKLNFKNSILIIDEVQNLVSDKGKSYKVLKEAIDKSPDNFRIVIATATPIFDKPQEIALTLNLLKPKIPLPIGKDFYTQYTSIKNNTVVSKNLNLFKRAIKGLVSHYRGAPPYVYPHMNLNIEKTQMGDYQHKKYLEIIKEEKTSLSKQNILELTNSFYIGARVVSNDILPPNVDNIDLKKNLYKYSCKFDKVFQLMKKTEGPVFIYSNFIKRGGLMDFIKVLDVFGYKNYENSGSGKLRYAIWTGEVKPKLREEIRTVFNKKNNINGEKIKILLGSPAIAEGVSTQNVRQVHMLEPYWNWSMMKQIIGRASRFCSHRDLPTKKRIVDVYIHLSTLPSKDKKDISIDEHILKISYEKDKLTQQFEKALKEASIDCRLFKNANRFKDEEPLRCMR